MKTLYLLIFAGCSFELFRAPRVEGLSEISTVQMDETTLRNVKLDKEQNRSNSFAKELNVTNHVSVVNYRQLREFRALQFFNDYFTFITSVPGIFTNALTIFVALKIDHRSTSELHMIILGCTDFQVVSVRLAVQILRVLEYNMTDVLCKLCVYVGNVGYLFSNWILVSWTAERFVAVLFPLNMNTWCTSRIVRKTLTVMFFICCLSLVPQLLATHSFYSIRTNKYMCRFTSLYYERFAVLEMCMYLYIPMIIVAAYNFAIVMRIRQTAIFRAAYMLNKNDSEKRAREQTQITIVLIIVASTFCLLHLPQLFAKLWQAVYPDPLIIRENNIRDYFKFSLLIVAGYQFTDFQNSINFFLYCIFASKVKYVLKQEFCWRHWKTRYLS